MSDDLTPPHWGAEPSMADTPTPEKVAMARRIAASQYPPSIGEAVLAGFGDDHLGVRTALAAIIETTEAAAKLAWTTKAYDDGLQIASGCNTTGQRIATALRNFEHLGKQHG